MHNIDKQDIINQNFKSTLNIIKKFEQAGKQGKDKLLLLFFGYDNVHEEIYEIPEIRNYVKKLIKKIPHLFYFLSNFQQNKGLITACISDINMFYEGEKLTPEEYMKMGLNSIIHGPTITVKIKMPNNIKDIIISGTKKYCNKIQDDANKILKDIPGI